jgi:hypothetical protein
MKKILCLIVGLAFIVGTAATTVAGELDIYGQYWGVVSAVNNGGSFEAQPFNEDADGDDWHAYQRMRQYFEYIASDNLKAVAGYEIDTLWGGAGSGNLAADEAGVIEIKRAMLEYTTDQGTTLNIGVQGFGLPGGATGNPVLGGDMSGITANVPINDMMSLTAGWIRLNEDRQPGALKDDGSRLPADGDSDAFLAVLPVQMEGMSASPYAVYSYLGEDYMNGKNATTRTPYHSSTQLLGTLDGEYRGTAYEGNAQAYWIGVPVSVTMMDPLVFEGQVIYGEVMADSNDELDRSGFYVDASAAMNMEWGTPTVFGLYSSGDDDNIDDGSETFPTLFSDGFVSPPFATAFGFNGCCSNLSYGKDYSFAQYTPNGVWQIGAGVQGLSFQDNLSHDIGVTYTRGTNDKDVGKALAGEAGYVPTATSNILLTKDDAAWQFRLYNQYDINENLYLALDLGAAMMDMDSSVWDARGGSDYLDDPITYSSAAIAYSF